MPIPFILGGLALAAGGYGVKKGLDASEKNDKAKRIIKRAKRRYNESKEILETKQEFTNSKLEDLGRLKVEIFTHQIKDFIELINKCKKGDSIYEDKRYLTQNEVKDLVVAVDNSLEISSGLLSGATAGALTGMGAYGAVGMLASASTGTAISTLSGAAATNATLAWLGGGSLASGGLGMAGGTAVLGGLVAGPLLAVGGIFLDTKAEENLTQAREQEAEVDIAVEQMDLVAISLDGIVLRVDELQDVLISTRKRFNKMLKNLPSSNYCQSEEFKRLMVTAKILKNLLDIPVLNKKGEASAKVTQRIEKTLKLGA